MQGQPLVSVIVPVYNREKLLERSIGSILSQDYENIEIIAVDDGSTDGSFTVLSRLAGADKRLTPIHQPNKGVARARNTGLRAASGKYIMFVDCDDTLCEGAVSEFSSLMEKTDADIAIAPFYMVSPVSRSVRDIGKYDGAVETDLILGDLCKNSNSFYYGVVWNKCFKRDGITEHHLLFDPTLDWGEDFAFVMRYLTYSKTVALSHKPIYEYIRHPDGLAMRSLKTSLMHPAHNIRMKLRLYDYYTGLFRARNQYQRYAAELWKYMFRVGIYN
ncbi:MAG: glycosyltransferase [Eubacteriales bacterium]|nr:glycosyltransferase [Eubacteriales bacterium]MDD3881322.1 glycosyltransferase [Eubacteriales bacterium]MDD4513702.1 glycosyltransferase [Eubacteriales bacterium]